MAHHRAPAPAAANATPLVFGAYYRPKGDPRTRYARIKVRLETLAFGKHGDDGDPVGFMMSEHGIKADADADPDYSWEPIRLLGRGGFGKVGLWSKMNLRGEAIDDVAIKETIALENSEILPHLSSEAVIQRDLNNYDLDSGTHTILKLRQYVYHQYKGQAMYRLYTEYCPNGDLNTLIARYHLWDTYFPELFIVHVFRCLVHAVTHMSKAPYPGSEALRMGNFITSNSFVAHLDLKPRNILIGNPVSVDNLLSDYPEIIVGDFGLARYSGTDDTWVAGMYNGHGTPGWYAPVSFCL